MSSEAGNVAKPRSSGRPPGDTGDRTRGAILDAALEMFATVGFDAMSVRELTRQLGVSHNLVHHHFGTKEELWRAAIDHGMGPAAEDWAALLDRSVGSPRSPEVLREVIEGGVALLAERPQLARILTDESSRPGSRLDYLYERYVGPILEILGRFLGESRAFGVRDVDSRVAALFVLSTVSAHLTHDALAAKLGFGSSSEYAAALVELVLGGLVEAAPRSAAADAAAGE